MLYLIYLFVGRTGKAPGKLTNICSIENDSLKKRVTNLNSTKTYSGVAGRENITLYDAALLLCPRLSVQVLCAGVGDILSIGTAW